MTSITLSLSVGIDTQNLSSICKSRGGVWRINKKKNTNEKQLSSIRSVLARFEVLTNQSAASGGEI